MPFYEYECQACKFYTEVMQKITDAPLTKCPSCGKRRLKKLVSAPVFRLKGGGWYETDFKGEGENKRNLLGADKDEPKSGAAEGKGDSKPEAAAGTKVDAKADAKADGKDAKPAAKESKPAVPKPARRTAAKAARGKAKKPLGRARR